ncbi:receptor-interacting serine threonine- kinase 3-like isoform X1 [Pelobates cultripes]|uniref:Receptor-interacting serine threonine- kinase 3-like isoform X1 n=1 Tax=Pelobates cultripes TaxID=61616 RepID=A0AAD1WWJ1_PELCU|nr:receptor-interacting serine threonine- kinase 3-like isoform X1 [Pelobates cultripes]
MLWEDSCLNTSDLKTLMKALAKESMVMQKASNPYVLRLLGVYKKVEGIMVQNGLVMEYMPHGSLHTLVKDIESVPWSLKFRIFHQVVLGMNYLHSLDPPIIHRDLKPGNVLLNKYLDVQITDFGLSKIQGATSSANPSIVGTLAYIPPEAFIDINYKPTESYDVYSFGILMWSVISGKEPYSGAPINLIPFLIPNGHRPDMSELDRWSDEKMVPKAMVLMVSCWSKQSEDRPSFHECSKLTASMFEAYESQIDEDVLILLKKIGAQAEQLTFEKQDVALTTTEIDADTPTEDTENSEDPLKNLTKTIKDSGEYKKIVETLSKDKILSSVDKAKLDSSDSLKDIGRTAEKAVLETIRKDPGKLISSIVKLWK